MTPKDKAHELTYKCRDVRWDIDPQTAKLCALIAVDEILNIYQIKNAAFEFYDLRNYWQEVKQEIEKL